MFRIRRQLRSNDFDVYGHLSQAHYHVHFADARMAFIRSRLPDSFKLVIVRIELDYLREIEFGESEIEMGLETTRVGNSSFELDHRLWRADGELSAQGTGILIAWDPERRASRPLTEAERQALQGN